LEELNDALLFTVTEVEVGVVVMAVGTVVEEEDDDNGGVCE